MFSPNPHKIIKVKIITSKNPYIIIASQCYTSTLGTLYNPHKHVTATNDTITGKLSIKNQFVIFICNIPKVATSHYSHSEPLTKYKTSH